jgi:hypothetical protein
MKKFVYSVSRPTPNAWVSRATAKQPTFCARPAEQPTLSQPQNAAAVASVATSHARRGISPPENMPGR